MDNNRMPVLFVGHGSPMNAIQKNGYTDDISKLGSRLPRPEAVLVVSAHWLTRGTRITAGSCPEQIYDFYGFPEELYRVRYRAPGSPGTAALVSASAPGLNIVPDKDRGVDHAAWAVLRHIFPDADVPVLELSLDIGAGPEQHYAAGKALASLREKGILIMGSGNIVHNLALMDYYRDVEPHDLAVEFDERVKRCLLEDRHKELIEYENWGKIAKYAAPTDDHYIPMLYAAALRQEGELIEFVHESIHHGSVSMRTFIISRHTAAGIL